MSSETPERKLRRIIEEESSEEGDTYVGGISVSSNTNGSTDSHSKTLASIRSRKRRKIDESNGSDSISEKLDVRYPKLLELFLNLRPTECVVPMEAWDFLTYRDLMQLPLLSKTLYDQLQYIVYPKCCNSDTDDYLVPYPGFPGLTLSSILKRNESDDFTGGLFSHQLASLRAMNEMENPTCNNPIQQKETQSQKRTEESDETPQKQQLLGNCKLRQRTPFGTLRGGVLGDAPGLGKTITMLALICSTAGARPVTPPTFWDEQATQDMWEVVRVNTAFRADIARCLRSVFVECRLRYQMRKNRQFLTDDTRIRKTLIPPYRKGHFPTFESFVKEAKRAYRSIGISRSSLEHFDLEARNFISGFDKSRRRFNLSQEGRRLTHERSLLPSSGTLIVVPNALMEHWCQQIHQNLKLPTFADEDNDLSVYHDEPTGTVREGVVYVMGLGDLAGIGKWTTLRTQGLIPSPPSATLSRYTIVLVSFEWCQKEFEEERRSGRMISKTRRSVDHTSNQSFFSTIRSSLLEIRWLRLVVDEGHELGARETASDLTTFIHHIAAERRWVLSGTPTTGDEDEEDHTSRALDQIQRLLVFLRHPHYGTSSSSSTSTISTPTTPSKLKRRRSTISTEERNILEARSVWERDIKMPFLQRQQLGKERLISLLKSFMVMHRKEDIDLPKPIFVQAEVDIPFPDHVEDQMRHDNPSLDGTKLAFQINRYLHTDDFQSLVDRGQADYIVETLRKARKEHESTQGRMVNGKIDPRPIKAAVYSSNNLNLRSVTDQIIRLVDIENVAELYQDATVGDLSSEISRFRHGVREYKLCPVCRRRGDVTDIRCRHPLIEVVSMQSLMHREVNGATNRGGEGESQEDRFLIEPERIRCTINVPLGRMEGESLSSYPKNTRFWRPNDILQVDVRNSHPVLAPREPESVWCDEYGANKCKALAQQLLYQGPDWYFGPLPYSSTGEEEANPSQRPPYALDVSLVKFQPCGTFHSRGRWYKGPRYGDAPLERVQEDVFILSLDGGLSHGLDLSFVTHMFLLEPIEDAALLEQVTSRAHRFGATGSVMIETVNTFYKIVSKDLEDALKKFDKKQDSNISSVVLQQDRDKILNKGHCDFCYRAFPTKQDAEKHELKCRSNPIVVCGEEDQFDLLTVYKNIRPPSAKIAGCF